MSVVPSIVHRQSLDSQPISSLHILGNSSTMLRAQAILLAGFHGMASVLIGSAILAALMNIVSESAHAAVTSTGTIPSESFTTHLSQESTDSISHDNSSQDGVIQNNHEHSNLERLEDAQQRLLDQSTSEQNGVIQQLDPEFNLYRLGPGDTFFVNVQRFPEANFQGTLDIQGNVIVPLVGIMSLQGLTLEQAKFEIQNQLARFYVDPVVDLTLVAQRPVQVTVLGEVVRPGLYPLATPQLTLALLTAGGSTRLANLGAIQIRRTLRNSDGAVVDYIEQNVDLFTALAQGQRLPDIQLSDGDVIIIPTLTADEALQYDRALIARSNFAQPSITIRVLSRPQRIGNVVLPNGSDFVDAITAISPDQSVSNLRDVALIRYVPETESVERFEFNARSALQGDISQNPLLEDNDVIIIGRNLIGRITNTLTTFTQPFRDILGFLLFFDTLSDSAETLFRPENTSN